MLSKTVKIGEPSVLNFFFPQFRLKEELSYTDRDNYIIYTGSGRRNLQKYLSENTKGFINTVGSPDIDFTDREVALRWVYSNINKEVPKTVVEAVKNYDDEYFMYCLKCVWASGFWPGARNSDSPSLYSLFAASPSSLRESYKIYLSLVEDMPAPVVESSFLTFLSRVKSVSDQAVSPGYLRLLKQCDMAFGSSVKLAVLKMAIRRGLRDELKFLDLITNLR